MDVLRNRRGGTQKTYFTMIDLILLLLIAVGFLAFIYQVASSTLLEKNYLARDIALLLDTVYASPGDTHYIYEGDASDFIILLDQNLVGVRKDNDVLAKQYWFADSSQGTLYEELVEPEDVVLIGINNQVLVRDHVIE